MSKEIRSVQFREFNVNSENDEMILEGYAAVFDQPTVLWVDNGFEYKEVLDRHAFDGADMKKCCLKYNHESGVPPLARVRGGSLELGVDDYGLKFRAKLFNTQTSRDVYEIVKAGGIDECSFAFSISEEGFEYDKASRTRTIRKIDTLWDCAVVDNPAYGGTSVSARDFFSAEAEKERLDRLEAEKREALKADIVKMLKELNDDPTE